MVSRRSTQSITQRSTRQSELHMARRPRRLVPPKTMDDTVGLSRKEERELKKALYASLQMTRRNRNPQSEAEDSNISEEPPSKLRKSTRNISANSSYLSASSSYASLKETMTTSQSTVDESSQDSLMSYAGSACESKKKIHAQRKFAQGCSLPSTPSTTPNKKAPNSPHNLLNRVPKTEDFLTFLCLRGSHILPPHLDFFNFSRDGASVEESSSNPRTPVSADQPIKTEEAREGTPESSSSSSNTNEELREISNFALAQRKAARASAGTPETARGIVSLRQGLTRKVAHSGGTPPSQHSKQYFFDPEKTPSPTGSRLLLGDITPAKKSASIKCLPSSFLRFSPLGKLVLERQGNQPLIMSKCSLQPSPLSIDKAQAQAKRLAQRSATEMAKSSKHDPANHKKEIQTANDISVRRTLELASKKLTRKDENLELASKKLTRKDESVVSKNTSKKDINLKSRHPGNFKNHSSKQKARRKAEQQKKLKVSREKDRKSKQEKRQVTSAHKHKRRTSLRLKTLAKILGKKRPNYSLVLSGYADMEEYEEEQKKKAAKSALAKARAEARAKVSMKNQEFHTDKMLTRSSAHSAVKVAVIKKTPSLKTDIVPIVKKDQSTLASIIETKRLKKEGGKDMDKEDQSIPHTSEKGEGKSHVAKPTQQKKVSPKKSTPEKSSLGLSQMPDPSLSGLVVVPTFYPTEEEFSDPIAYISSIKDKAEPFGMCRIIPPPVWKMESKLNEEIRFTTQIQHLHRLFNRWGPSVELSRAISLHLRDVIRDPNCLPQIGGVEVDLPQLYSMIRVLGGLQNIVDKKQWVRVADAMKIPKAAHDRVTRLYDIYCKYVLPYAMVTEAERQQAQKDVHDSYDLSSAEEEAILKGKSMTLSAFSRIARNVQSMWFKDDPSPELVEAAYWKIVKERDSHVAVQCAHVNTRAQATGFPTRRESPYFRHSWNLNNLPDNKKCILKCLGPVSGTTIPTLHVGMLFSTSCWSTDPHRLPYVQYLHSGANTIWYCIPKSHVSGFHKAMKELCPTLLHNDPRWLKEDIAMVKPDELMARGVNVMRCIQQPRQFVVVFPDAYTATVCCGYSVSESVHYATADWLSNSVDAAKDLCASGEKEMFSVDTLVCNLCQDSSDPEILAAALPLLESIVAREVEERHELSAAGLKCERRLAVEDGPGTSSLLARKRSHDLTEDSICEVCCKICYLSMVLNEHDEQILCLEHGLRYVQRKRHTKAAKLFYRYTEEELAELVLETKDRLATLSNGSNSIKKRSLKKQDSRS